MTVTLASYDIDDPKDMTALKTALDRHEVSHVRRVAIFSKLNGEYDDGALHDDCHPPDDPRVPVEGRDRGAVSHDDSAAGKDCSGPNGLPG